MTALHLETVLNHAPPAGNIELTDEQVATLGPGKTMPVLVTIGDRTARLRLARMGGKNLIGFSKAAREELGVELGQEIEATVDVDTAERTVDVPPALAVALDAEPGLRERFEAVTYSRRKEMARNIADAKQEETRQRRLKKVLEELRD
ncbi:YdeI/OmpD-associated family protein [Microbacterium sp.]|uniref:YdeI/OmpD-associated family protein n=1 Tax=Microbacterium sp. TaxID=51671 RepID=UPI00281136C7|nr:YdeI/OmpD-associated family protein [Microbacterium sp.]